MSRQSSVHELVATFGRHNLKHKVNFQKSSTSVRDKGDLRNGYVNEERSVPNFNNRENVDSCGFTGDQDKRRSFEFNNEDRQEYIIGQNNISPKSGEVSTILLKLRIYKNYVTVDFIIF